MSVDPAEAIHLAECDRDSQTPAATAVGLFTLQNSAKRRTVPSKAVASLKPSGTG